MIGIYHCSVIVTYLGVCLSLSGIFFSIQSDIRPAFICLIFAGICDLFDGKVARLCKRTTEEKLFGIQIDSFADVVSFLVFPAVIAWNVSDLPVYLLFPLLVIYVLAGITRLAWFNIHADAESSTAFYQGLPVTYTALILPSYYLLSLLFPAIFRMSLYLVLYPVLAFFFLLNRKIKKPGGLWYLFFSILAILMTLGLALL